VVKLTSQEWADRKVCAPELSRIIRLAGCLREIGVAGAWCRLPWLLCQSQAGNYRITDSVPPACAFVIAIVLCAGRHPDWRDA
jgi:hypothetical protein